MTVQSNLLRYCAIVPEGPMSMTVCMFPGQGAQKKGMGQKLFGAFPQWLEQANGILGYALDELCLHDPREELGLTQFTQPALYVVNAMAYEAWGQTCTERPDALLGHSLGEYNALLAAGVFDFATGLRLVQRRGELMAQCSGGGMAAVMRASREELREILDEEGLEGVDLANFNAPSQIVISGLHKDIERAKSVLESRAKGVIVLKTGGAFHSRYMREAMVEFGETLSRTMFRAPTIPVIANYDAQPYQATTVAFNLENQIASPVRWVESVEYLLGSGTPQFEEVGDSRVLTNLVRRISKEFSKRPRSQGPDSKPETSVVPRATLPAEVGGPRGGLDAEAQVARWNRECPVGTRIASKVVGDQTLVTKTPATVLFGHRAAVYVDGYNGYFDLDEVSVVENRS